MHRPCSAIAAVVVLAMVAGCDPRPPVLVMCHNSNCTGRLDPSRDDTLDALRESFELVDSGSTLMFDGTELDLVWDSVGRRCLFAHDPPDADADDNTLVGATEATDEVIRLLTLGDLRPHNGDRFYVKFELKVTVDESGGQHTASELTQHADCALDQLATLEQAAVDLGLGFEVIFDSSGPELLNALTANPRWPVNKDAEPARVRLSADFGAPRPLMATRPLGDFPPVDVIEFHPSWLTEGTHQTYRSMGVDLTVWADIVTIEVLRAVEHFEPKFVLTGEVPLVRGWLER